MITGLNYGPILTILTNTKIGDFGIVLSFLSLFASSAIGFLVSQLWHTHFHRIRVYAKVYQNVLKDMETKLDWKPKQPEKDSDIKTAAVLDYML